MTKAELFDAGISKADCRSLPEAAAAARSSLQQALSGAHEQFDQLARALVATDRDAPQLTASRAVVECEIDREMNRAKQMVLTCLDARATELKQSIASEHAQRWERLEARQVELTQLNDRQSSLCAWEAEVIKQDDLTVFRLFDNVCVEEVAVAEAVSSFKADTELAGDDGSNVKGGTAGHSLDDVVTVAQEMVAALSTVAAVGAPGCEAR